MLGASSVWLDLDHSDGSSAADTQNIALCIGMNVDTVRLIVLGNQLARCYHADRVFDVARCDQLGWASNQILQWRGAAGIFALYRVSVSGTGDTSGNRDWDHECE